jgi:putative ABC transport system permease protein
MSREHDADDGDTRADGGTVDDGADAVPGSSLLPGTRVRAAAGIAVAQIRHYRVRSVLSVLGVAMAVVLVISLGGLGYGLTTTGDQAIDWLDRDLWATSGSVELRPGGVGGVSNPIPDAHRTADGMARTEGVRSAQALSFQTVYVSNDTDEFESIVGVGFTGNGSRLNVKDGPGFSQEDVHYANGSYDGPMTHTVAIDRRTAERYDVGINDTLYLGGTLVQARQNGFRVVAITGSFSTFLGTPTAAVHLSELQEVSGTTGTDRASIIGLSLSQGAATDTVRPRLQRGYPEFEYRNNDEQVSSIIGRQASVLVGAGTLVLLSLVAGMALVVNTLALIVYHQREALAMLKAIGVRGRTLGVLVGTQGLAFGAIGGAVGCLLVPPLVTGLNGVIADLTGFANLIKTPPWLFAVGMGLALSMGLVGALVAGWRVARLEPLAVLSRRA